MPSLAVIHTASPDESWAILCLRFSRISISADELDVRLCIGCKHLTGILLVQVDCIYFDEDLAEIADDPADDVKDALSRCQIRGLENSCPQCFENQQRLVSITPHAELSRDGAA